MVEKISAKVLSIFLVSLLAPSVARAEESAHHYRLINTMKFGFAASTKEALSFVAVRAPTSRDNRQPGDDERRTTTRRS